MKTEIDIMKTGKAGSVKQMKRVIATGVQDFESLRVNQRFYVDKTDFIREWWNGGDAVTLITRPRRFGKTLNMSMLNCFFSRKYLFGPEQPGCCYNDFRQICGLLRVYGGRSVPGAGRSGIYRER